ncbi:MAG TPA: zf-HC2 domain-containing protein [Blastocatellia bacterium]
MTDTNETPNCDMREALVSYLYNEATLDESRDVENHLVTCPACKQEVMAFERVRGMLQQWRLEDMPIMRMVTEPLSPRRAALAVLKELFVVTPAWAKALGGAAMALLVLAVMGTNISIGSGGFSFRADILRRQPAAQAEYSPVSQGEDEIISAANIERVRADVKTLVSQMVAESERRQKEDMKAQLISLESQLQNMRSADLARIATRVQEHQSRLKIIERDIDRREGSNLTDILFGELMSKPEAKASVAAGSGGD